MSQQCDSLPDDALSEPDEIINLNGYSLWIYNPKFDLWIQAVDEHLLDLTGYSVYVFAKVPTEDDWCDWPDNPYDQ